MTGRPMTNQTRGFQIPPPANGFGQLGAAEQAYVSGMQEFAQSQQPQQEGFEMPPPAGGPLAYQANGKIYQLDPNAVYYRGIGGIPKRAEMV